MRIESHKKRNKSKISGKSCFPRFVKGKQLNLFRNDFMFRNDFTNSQKFAQGRLHILFILNSFLSPVLRYMFCYSEANLLRFQIITNSVFNSQKSTPKRTLNRTWSPIPPAMIPKHISRYPAENAFTHKNLALFTNFTAM